MEIRQASTDLPRELVIEVHTEGVRQVVTVSGDLDLYTAPRLRQELVAQARRGHDHLVVDISAVTFLDSVALGVLVGARKRIAGVEGTFGIVCADERLLRIFRITGLVESLAVVGSLD